VTDEGREFLESDPSSAPGVITTASAATVQARIPARTPGIPRALLSYSWDSDEHKDWVLALAERLQGESGVEILFDQWYLMPGNDRLHFMEQGVSQSDFVIVVCTPGYAQRADGRQGGVGYESMVITGELADHILVNKFIPVLRDGSWLMSLPDSIQAMATDALTFLDALGLKQIDLFGFSIGGMVAQQMVLDKPELVKHLILAGTGPEGGEGIDIGGLPPSSVVLADASLSHFDRQQRLFFAPTETSQAAGHAFFERKHWRKDNRDPEATPAVARAQTIAIKSWGEQKKGERYGRLKEIKQPTLVFNGINDVMIPTTNSYILALHIPDARLVLYPDSGHGALSQFPVQFCAEVKLFLDNTLR
jgi:pimeloyl-ACP methyl ester carboxylesterase